MQDVKGCVAKCLIVNSDNHILLLTIGEHTKFPHLSYAADLPGGIIEHNETARDGVMREIKEETGIDVLPGVLHEVYRAKTVVPDIGALVEKRLYIARTKTAEVQLSYEHESYRWVTLDEILDTTFTGFYFDDFIREALRCVVNERLV